MPVCLSIVYLCSGGTDYLFHVVCNDAMVRHLSLMILRNMMYATLTEPDVLRALLPQAVGLEYALLKVRVRSAPLEQLERIMNTSRVNAYRGSICIP